MLESNNLVSSRLELMDDTLDSLRKSAESVRDGLMTVVANGSNDQGMKSSKVATQGALASLIGSLNVTSPGSISSPVPRPISSR